MSSLSLPAGTTCLVNLLRPEPPPVAVGCVAFSANAAPWPAEDLANAISDNIDQLMEPLSTLLLPGAPVVLLIHCETVDGTIFTGSFGWPVDRAVSHTSLGWQIVDHLPHIVRDMLVQMAAAATAKASLQAAH